MLGTYPTRTTIAIDDELFAEAQEFAGVTEKFGRHQGGPEGVCRARGRASPRPYGRDATGRQGSAASALQVMVLADTSIWIDHFRRGDVRLAELLERGDVVMHPFIVGELLLGNVAKMTEIVDDLNILPRAIVASADEVLNFIADRKLPGSGIGYVDAHLLAAAALTPETSVWMRDKRLLAPAQSLSLATKFQE